MKSGSRFHVSQTDRRLFDCHGQFAKESLSPSFTHRLEVLRWIAQLRWIACDEVAKALDKKRHLVPTVC